jgi:predicted small lipoprotein YifL
MSKTVSILLSLPILMSLVCCGKKGDILPPLIKVPQTAEDVQAVQRGNNIIVTWQNPTAYVDGSALPEIEEIEIWLLKAMRETEKVKSVVGKEEFQQKAKLAFSMDKENFPEYTIENQESESKMQYFYELSGEDPGTQQYIFGIRIKERKRYSDFSDLASLKPLLISLPPTDLEAKLYQDKIEVGWKAPLKNIDQSSPPNFKGYNIYRSIPEEEPIRINSELVKSEKYADKDFNFGQNYRYMVRASATNEAPFFESLDSESIEILAEDSFPPKPPEGLISVGATGMIAISWNENGEKDLAGYRVWRREEREKEFRLLTPQAIKESSYNDTTVENDKNYYYAVTAVDTEGNESQKSQIISGITRKGLL